MRHIPLEDALAPLDVPLEEELAPPLDGPARDVLAWEPVAGAVEVVPEDLVRAAEVRVVLLFSLIIATTVSSSTMPGMRPQEPSKVPAQTVWSARECRRCETVSRPRLNARSASVDVASETI